MGKWFTHELSSQKQTCREGYPRLHARSVVDELAGGAGAGVLDDIDGHLLDGVTELGAATLVEANEVGSETGDVWGGHGGTREDLRSTTWLGGGDGITGCVDIN